MKNYYKILGVKETASEEEIREKWIKLMRKFHPDWRMQGVPEDERVKEINEAYQTLKFSSTRMRYDLKKAYERKKRKSYVRRYSFPISMLTALTALIITGTLYLKNSTNNSTVPNILNVPISPNNPNASPHQPVNASTLERFNGLYGQNELNVLNIPYGPNVPNEINVFNGPSGPNAQNELNRPNDPNDINITPHPRINKKAPAIVKKSINAKNPIDSKKVLSGPTVPKRPNDPNELNVPNGPNGINEPNVLNGLNGPNDPNKPITKLPNNLITKLLNDPMTQKPIDLSPATSDLVMESSSQLSKPSNIPVESSVPDKPEEPNVLNDPNAYTHQRIYASTLERFNEPNGPNDLNVVRMTTSMHQPSMATEQEIRQFLANYTDRYIRKDLDGFLSLFSLRAVQNRQDGWEGIRKVYGNFFKHSKDIRYSLEDTEIEFYQNGLEVKASYELTQTLKRRDEMKTWRGRIRWVLIKEEGALKILSLDYQHYKIP